MSQSITKIAQQLRDSDKKVQLIYGFNGTGKTRLSRTFKELVAPKGNDEDDAKLKILYYNAFTEDLFYWDNDLEGDVERKLRIHPNAYTQWALQDQGQDRNAIAHFQRYTEKKLTPRFNAEYLKDANDPNSKVPAFSEITFSFEPGDDTRTDHVKISKGEESNFIWSIFYAVIEQVIQMLNEPGDRETNEFDQLEYIFIDDPVSSLDDNHLIQLAVDLAETIKLNDSAVRFIITTHNPLFFNILCNEFYSDDKRFIGERRINWKREYFLKYRLEKSEDGTHRLIQHPNDAPFSYHLRLMRMLQDAAETGRVEKYHFNILRNVLEKSATFLGYKRWERLLPEAEPGRPNPYLKRILNFSSHSRHSADEVAEPGPQDTAMLQFLINHLVTNCGFEKKENWNG